MTLLTLLPTSALAASGSGTGIKPTDNTNYWTTRLLHDGTPYSYKPPMAAGKMLYCLDRGYGYRWGTPSFLNSYTYTSATGADADAVLKTALAQSGMGELDAQQLENFKWMMSFIVDYKGDIPGSLFMAAQTYVWDHQTFKGEGDGDIDGGGYANADTYEMYLGYIDWMLKEKAKEDAEFQRQIEEYAEQGIIATSGEKMKLQNGRSTRNPALRGVRLSLTIMRRENSSSIHLSRESRQLGTLILRCGRLPQERPVVWMAQNLIFTATVRSSAAM